jgi:hypothetical protein
MTRLSRRAWLERALQASASLAWLQAGVVRAQATGFDHAHAAWTALLRRHVRPVRGGQATQVAYAGFAADRTALKAYLDGLSAANPA